ncbi:MAG: DUF3631 domain-containing protein [Alcaligenaceae bacterium]|nr:MAG: DUF3631 domain-containing protein [Alcaligenaceae bacterium]
MTEKKAAEAAVERLFNKNVPHQMPEPVDGDALMSDLIQTIKRYVVVSDHGAVATALWVINSWAYESFNRCPLLLINAPERECGKTQLLKIVDMLAKRPMETANVTMAALFRMVNNYKPTLLIDEADTFMSDKSELAGIVNKGYERGGVVLRVDTIGKELVERAYEVYGPKAMAGITLERHLPEATISRGIQIPLQRKTREDNVERLRSANPAVFKDLYSRINRFVEEHRSVFVNGWDDLPDQLSDRQQDNWEPLLAIANCLGAKSYEMARQAALRICVETAPAKSSGNQLLEDIREVLTDYRQQRIPSQLLLEFLISHEDMDWIHYNRGDPLTKRQLAKFLGQYKIESKTVRMSATSTPKGYEVRAFDDAFARYLPPKSDGGEGDIEYSP